MSNKNSDLISRQAAIEALRRAEALTRAFGYHNVIDTIRELPSANQWIPCSERLPEEEDRVLVTDEDGEIEVAWYEYNEWSEDKICYWWCGEYRVFPVAWMPLPEPWKGESDANNNSQN